MTLFDAGDKQMTNEERKIFWETLCSLSSVNVEKELSQLNNAIILPPAIYHYRKKVDKNTLEALENNQLFFSTADYYDDPFDTYINIDFDLVKTQIVEGITDQGALVTRFKECRAAWGNPFLNDELLEFYTKDLCENTEKYIDFLSFYNRTSRSFSSDVFTLFVFVKAH